MRMTKHQPWTTLSYRQVIDTPYLRVRCEQVAVPGGPVIPDYYIVENRGWVGIVPFTRDGRFLINNQYKHGIGLEVLEFPAGSIDAGEEDPQATAHRELLALIHDGSFAVQGQVAAAYMALERLGFITSMF